MLRNRRAMVLAFLSMIVGLSTWSQIARAQDARGIAQRVFRGVTLIVVQDGSGQPLALGSGFVLADSLIVTNAHVIEKASGGYAKLVGSPEKVAIAGVAAIDPIHDLALLVVPGIRGTALILGNSDSVAIGEIVYAVGNPKGLEGTFSSGIVSGIRTVGRDTLLQITAPISPGSSGGPIVNSAAEVIAVAVATYRDGQNLNFAIPATYVRALLQDRKPIRKLASVPTSTRQAAVTSSLGGRSVDGVTLNSFTWTPDPSYSMGGTCIGECEFTFTVRNRLRQRVADIRYVVVFYDHAGEVIDVQEGVAGGYRPILAGLGSRERGSVDASVRRLTARWAFRVIDFRIIEE